MRRVPTILSLDAFVWFAACVGDDPAASSPPAGSDAGAEADSVAPGSIQVSVPSQVTVVAGTTAKVSVSVTRGEGVAGDIRLELAGAPPGVSASALRLSEGQTSGDLDVVAAATTTHGTFPIKVVATADASTVSAEATFELFVRGTSGELDTSFGAGGKTVRGFGASEVVTSAALAPDGKIVVAGYSADSSVFVARFTADGEPDTTFNGTGHVITQFAPDGKSLAYAVAVRPDKRIVVGGSYGNTTFADFALLRLLENGAPDTAFGDAGRKTYNVDTYDRIRSLVLMDDGKIVVIGDTSATETAGPLRATIMRMTELGSLDASGNFGLAGNGFFTNTSPSITTFSVALAKRAGAASGFYIGGYSNGNDSAPYVAPFSMLVLRFGQSGLQVAPHWSATVGTSSSASGLCVQPDDKPIVVGSAQNGGQQGFAIVRFTTDGDLDPTFGGTPGVGMQFLSLGGLPAAHDCAVLDDGKIVVGGLVEAAPVKFGMVRLTSAGTLDPTFGDGGKVVTRFGALDTQDARLQVLLTQPDGRIVAVGYMLQAAGDFDVALARYWP